MGCTQALGLINSHVKSTEKNYHTDLKWGALRGWYKYTHMCINHCMSDTLQNILMKEIEVGE